MLVEIAKSRRVSSRNDGYTEYVRRECRDRSWVDSNVSQIEEDRASRRLLSWLVPIARERSKE